MSDMANETGVTIRSRRGRKRLHGVVTWVRLPEPTHRLLAARAAAEARPMSDLIRAAVERLLEAA
jgi:hypothetical protein